MSNNKWDIRFFLLWLGQLISSFGDSIYEIALGFWVLVETGSTGLMSILMAGSIIPRIFLSPIAGTFADRHNRKKILIITDLLRGLVICFIGIAALMDFVSIWMVAGGGILLGLCGSFFNPSIQAVVPSIVGKDKLVRANSLFALSSTGIDILGKSVGGILYKVIGSQLIILINGISFIFSAFFVSIIKIPEIQKQNKNSSFFEDMKSGFNYVKNFEGLKYLYAALAVLNFFGVIATTLLLPLFNAKVYLGPEKYGLAMACSSSGMVAGFALFSFVKIKRLKKFTLFTVCGLVSTFSMAVLPFVSNYIFILIILLIDGILTAVINSITQTTIQVAVDEGMRGKAFGFKNTLSSLLVPIAMSIGGILAEFIPIEIVISVSCCMVFILLLRISFIKSVKELVNSF